MSIIEIVKDENEEVKNGEIETKQNVKTFEDEITLECLNSKKREVNKITHSKNLATMNRNNKEESSIIESILATLLMVFFIGGIIVGGSLVLLNVLDLKIELFEKNNYYSVEMFNSSLAMFLITILIFMTILSIVFVFIINTSVKLRFRKQYLSKTNVYVYDAFLCTLNVFVFSIIGVIFFVILNNYNNDFTAWIKEGIVDPGVKLDIVNAFKYVIVVIAALFISLNSLRGISIVHKKNDFIFQNHL